LKKSFIYYTLLFTTLFASCKTDNVNGIIIDDTLYVHQSFGENRRMQKLIKNCLNKDKIALQQLINFPNGGGASSYDLGYVITQIIYRLGENEFVNLISTLNKKDINNLKGLIGVGLEYGDNDYDNKMDNREFEIEFPKLYKLINAD